MSPTTSEPCSLNPLLPTISGSKSYTELVEGDALMLVGHLSLPENPYLTGNFTSIATAVPKGDIAKIEFFLGCFSA
ncbi:hypothetical protein C2845_PM07G11750 [Panicum miliaceum]|uniref:Uncharacterized protein n=1 Tax=Panicum miliaceum TaxID=4540 RepID=A0A3L6SMI7_PANMI|nr:hypothetical protein C2845_PM07G11750 [Panicum miliaceum]